LNLKEALAAKVSYQTGDYINTGALLTHVWQKDGIYAIRETSLATFVIKISHGQFSGLKDNLKEGITLKIPKVPYKMYEEVLAFYRFFYKKHNTEVYTRIYYSPDTDSFKHVVIDQLLKPEFALWSFDNPADFDVKDSDILVMQLHSHHIMPGYFSSKDTETQQSLDGIHMVIGRINYHMPNYQIRFSFGEKKVNLNFTDLFDKDIKEDQLDLKLFKDWKKRCKIDKKKAAYKNDQLINIPIIMHDDFLDRVVYEDDYVNEERYEIDHSIQL